MKVLYMSGYTDNVVLDQGFPTAIAFLQKPIAPGTLSLESCHLVQAHRAAALTRVGSGVEALHLLAQNGDTFDLVITRRRLGLGARRAAPRRSAQREADLYEWIHGRRGQARRQTARRRQLPAKALRPNSASRVCAHLPRTRLSACDALQRRLVLDRSRYHSRRACVFCPVSPVSIGPSKSIDLAPDEAEERSKST